MTAARNGRRAPGPLRERMRVHGWIATSLAAIGVAGAIAANTLPAPDPNTLIPKLGLLAAVVAGFVGFLLWQSVRWRAACRRAESLGWKACPACQYDLTRTAPEPGEAGGREGSVVCPECGLRTSWESIDAHWKWSGNLLAATPKRRGR